MHATLSTRRGPAALLLAATVGVAAVGLAPAGASAQVLPTPLLQYTFDDGVAGASTPATDTGSGTPAPGVLNGPAVYSTNTPDGTGLSADLTDDQATTYAYVATAGDAPKLDSLAAFTASTWVNVSAYAGGNRRLLAKQNGGAFEGFSFGVASATAAAGAPPEVSSIDNLNLTLFVGGTDAFGIARTGNLDLGDLDQWAFVAVTYDGTATTDNVTFYVGDADTAPVAVGTLSAPAGTTLDSDAAFGLGYTGAAPTSNQSLVGLMDDARVYGSVLSGGDLDAVRLSNLGGPADVPEPAGLAALGLAGLALARRRPR